jgi:hypothetical protein
VARRGRRGRRPNIKDLELPTFSPSPKVSVSTWIDRVDLALEGARSSGRGNWTDSELFFILGNKLMDSASRWWVTMNRKPTPRERTWTTLKTALLRRYGERLDISAAEWRVNQRQMIPGETYADFAAGLRDATGRNLVEERVLLAQFYRCLNLTVKQLVKQRNPRTLDQAVDYATEIDDTNANVAQGMQNIVQPWATAPSPYLIPMAGTTGQTMVIPGVGGTGLPLEAIVAQMTTTGLPLEAIVAQMTTTGGDAGAVALFTNPQGVWNKFSGTWDVPKGRQWNGKFWAETARKERKSSAEPAPKRAATSRADKKARVLMAVATSDSSDDDTEAGPPPPKWVKRESSSGNQTRPRSQQDQQPRKRGDGKSGGNNGPPGELLCYAFGQPGHFADRCPDPVAKARNDAYLASRHSAVKPAENDERA